MLEQCKCSLHISGELEELIPCRGEFDLIYLLLVLLPCLLLLHGQRLILRELLDVNVHANIDIEGLAATILSCLNTCCTGCQYVADRVVHVHNLTHSQGILPQMASHAFLLLTEGLDECIGVLDGDTHLQQIL